MKKYVENLWMRIAASLICAVAVLGIIVAMIPAVFFWQAGDSSTVYKNGQKKIADNYALYIYDELMAGRENELADFLSETNMDAAVVKIENSLGADVPEEEKTSMIYNFSQVEVNIEEVEEKTEIATNPEFDKAPEEIDLSEAYMLEIYDGSAYTYNIDSLLGAMQSNVYFSEDSYMVPTKVIGITYDLNTGIFYYETTQGYYEVTYIYVEHDGVNYDYRLISDGTTKYYYNDYYDIVLDRELYYEWKWVQIEGIYMYFGGGQVNQVIDVAEDSSVIEERVRDDYYYVSDMTLFYSDAEAVDKYQIYISVDEPEYTAVNFAKDDLFQEWRQFVNYMSAVNQNATAALLTFVLLLIIAFVALGFAAPNKVENLGFFHKLPVFSFTFCVGFVEVCALAAFYELAGDIYYGRFYLPINITIPLAVIIAGVGLFIGFLYLGNIIGRIKTKTFWRYSEFYYISRPIVSIWNMAKNNIPLFWKGIVLMLAISFVEFVVIAANMWEGDNIIFWFLLGKVIEIPLVIFVLLQMKELQNGSKRIAEGDLSQPIDISKLRWEFKEHGENLNSVSESISRAVDKQMKSERFKTELITNVSHDIKTPLTSIINYVDLIKKEELTDPTLCEYVDVLDRQSNRLKKLIEDLMEASKASTGNLPVQFEECDIEVLLTQIIGEFEDKLAANELELIVDKPETPVKVNADGRHMWRVLDNLMNNACKYAQPHTRVYVSLNVEGQTATITFKNISKAALNIPSDELMERFVRGDSSRNTEGSGLGLSIAQSLTELMNGSMKLDIDGDLFKVTLKFHAL